MAIRKGIKRASKKSFRNSVNKGTRESTIAAAVNRGHIPKDDDHPHAVLESWKQVSLPTRFLRQGMLTNGGKPEYQLSAFEKIQLAREGVSKKALENLKEKASLDYDQLSTILNVGRTTLLNKRGNDLFNEDLSDKIVGLADIYSYGYEVFEDRDRFNDWIFRSNKALGGKAPFKILHNSFGREEVKHLIGRIDHGVYS